MNQKRIILAGWLIACVFFGTAQKSSFNIVEFGAKADSKTDNTKVIQQAIDAAAKTGKGTVIVPAGYYVTGPIVMKTGVELHLADGATLLASINRMDYGIKAQPLISARGQQNVAITGTGTIDGRGREVVKDLFRLLHAGTLQDSQWKIKRPGEAGRPEIIVFTECQQVRMKGITVKNSAGWVQSYIRCTDVAIDSMTVNSTEYWNNDGIDVVNSHNVRISNCNIDAADDAIVLKSEGEPGTCEDITVTNCTLRSSANAFKLGTGSHGGFRNIKVRNLTVFNTYRSAVALEAVDGGFIENVDVRDVVAKYTGNAILIRLGHRNTDEKWSTIKNVYIGNMQVEIPVGKPDIGYPIEGPPLKYPHNVFPAAIAGLPGHPVQGVTLENIEITYEGGASKAIAYFNSDSLENVPENPTGYPEFSMWGEMPAWGFYLRHAENITFKNVKLVTQGADFRPAIITDDVKDLTIERLSIPKSELPVIIYNKSQNVQAKSLAIPTGENAVIKR